MLYAHFYQIIECQSISLLLHSHDFFNYLLNLDVAQTAELRINA